MGSSLSCLKACATAQPAEQPLHAQNVAHPDVFWRGSLERTPPGFEDLTDLMHHLPPAYRTRHHGHVVVRSGSDAAHALREVMARFGDAGLTDGMVRDALLRGHHPERLPAISTFIRYGLLDFSRHTEPADHAGGSRSASSLFLFKECSLLHRMALEAESGHHHHAHPETLRRLSASYQVPYFEHGAPHTTLRARFSMLAHAGVNLNMPAHDGITPLMLAVGRGCEATARAMIEEGARLDITDVHGFTALHWAARTNHPALVEMLLLAGSPREPHDARGWTPLHCAAAAGHVEVVRMLSVMGAEMNTRDLQGASPLLLAVRRRHPAVIHALIEGGASANLAHPPLHYAPLHEAARLGYYDEALSLLECGAEPNVVDDEGMTPLHLAGLFPGPPVPRRELAESLLNFGAEQEIRARSGERPVDFAGRQGNEFVFKMLVERGAMPPHKFYVRNLDP